MRVNSTAKIITCFVYDKKNKETKELTGEKGLMISLLIDERPDVHLSGKVIEPFVDPKTYRGILDFSNVSQMEEVNVDMDIPTNPKGSFVLYNLSRIEKKK